MDESPLKRKRCEPDAESCSNSVSSSRAELSVLRSLVLPHETIQNIMSRDVGELSTPMLMDAVCSAVEKEYFDEVQPLLHTSPQMRYCSTRCPAESFTFIKRTCTCRRYYGLPMVLVEEVFDLDRKIVLPHYQLHFSLERCTDRPPDVPPDRFADILNTAWNYGCVKGFPIPVGCVVHSILHKSGQSCTYKIEQRDMASPYDTGRGETQSLPVEDGDCDPVDLDWTLTVTAEYADVWPNSFCDSDSDDSDIGAEERSKCLGLQFWGGHVVLDEVYFTRVCLSKIPEEDMELLHEYFEDPSERNRLCAPFTPRNFCLDACFNSLTFATPFWQDLGRIEPNFCKDAKYLEWIDLSGLHFDGVDRISKGFMERCSMLRQVHLQDIEWVPEITDWLSNCGQLTELHLPQDVEKMENVANDCPKLQMDGALSSQEKLEEIHNCFNGIGDTSITLRNLPAAAVIRGVFSNMRCLTKLDLTDCFEELNTLCNFACDCPVLETVLLGCLPALESIGEDRYSTGHHRRCYGFLSHCPSLTSLDMHTPELLTIHPSTFTNTPQLKFDLAAELVATSNCEVIIEPDRTSPFLHNSLIAKSTDWFKLIRYCDATSTGYLFYSYVAHLQQHEAASSENEKMSMAPVCGTISPLEKGLEEIVSILCERCQKQLDDGCAVTELVDLSTTVAQVFAIMLQLASSSSTEQQTLLKTCMERLSDCFVETLSSTVESCDVPRQHQQMAFAMLGYNLHHMKFNTKNKSRQSTPPVPEILEKGFVELFRRASTAIEKVEEREEGWENKVAGLKIAAYITSYVPHNTRMRLDEEQTQKELLKELRTCEYCFWNDTGEQPGADRQQQQQQKGTRKGLLCGIDNAASRDRGGEFYAKVEKRLRCNSDACTELKCLMVDVHNALCAAQDNLCYFEGVCRLK